MKQFKDFSIKPAQQGFIGDKIKITKVLNKKIAVHDYKVENSKYEGECLHLQISIGETKHVLFTGSMVLMDAIEQIPKNELPFTTTIVQDNDRYEFT
jgi:hypothetical protein